MTCKFCGSVLEDNEFECPYCGHKTGLGVPDEEEIPAAAPKKHSQASSRGLSKMSNFVNVAQNSVSKVKAAAPSPVSGGAKKLSSLPIFILCLLCLLFSLISLFTCVSIKNNLEDVNQNMLSQFYQMQNFEDQLASKIDELGSSVGSVSTTISEQQTSRNINITKEPSSVATYIGRGGPEDNVQNNPIFMLDATGVNLTFTWQRYDDASGSWVNLVWDTESNNTTYGLHVYTDASKGHSELAAHGVTSAAFGTYRCKIEDSFGEKFCEPVTLSEREKDA